MKFAKYHLEFGWSFLDKLRSIHTLHSLSLLQQHKSCQTCRFALYLIQLLQNEKLQDFEGCQGQMTTSPVWFAAALFNFTSACNMPLTKDQSKLMKGDPNDDS